MKSELDHFRKFSLVDYSVNLKKFKEYLEFCRKNCLFDEKIFILENLVNQTNEKSQSGAPNIAEILNNYTNLCVLVVIFSDFEIENFFKIQNFSLNFQKTILFQAINYCLDRLPEQHEQIYYKFQFWVIKLMNKNISSTGDLNPNPPIYEEELNQSILNLCKKIQLEYNCSLKANLLSPQGKSLNMKISYELGYYFYLINDAEKMNEYFTYCFSEMNFDTNDINYNTIYFKRDEIVNLLDFCSDNDFMFKDKDKQYFCLAENVEMREVSSNLDLERESNLNEEDFEIFFNKISIGNQAKMIIDKFCIDDLKTLEMFNYEELLKCSKNMIFLSFKNYHKLKEAKLYIEKVIEIINKRQTMMNTLSENEKKELTTVKKENSYHVILINLIDSVYNKEEKLRKQFLSGLSESILKLTLTDDLEISGLIHGLIINFTQSFKSVFNYFNDFVDFFQQTTTYNQIETVNQIFFISTVLKIINYILFTNFPANTVVSTVTIEGEIHFQVFNLIFFWLNSIKENKTNKKDNILFVLIRTIKNSNFLLVLKIILLGVLKFVIEKKNLSTSINDEIYEQMFQINPSSFKIDSLINENKNNPKFSNLKILFKEETNQTYNYDALKLDYFEEVLFKLIRKIEKKITKYGKYSEVELLERKNNLLFFENLARKKISHSADVLLNKVDSSDKITEVDNSKIILEYLKYYKTFFADFKLKFYKNDLFENFNVISEYYEEFKKLIDEVILFRFIYILSSLNKTIEASILLQYTKKIDYDLAYKFIKRNVELQNIDKLEYIWKLVYFELLSNLYYQRGKTEYLDVVNNMIKRTSNHQFFKRHPLRKLFKIINFFKFIDNLTI